MIYNYRNEARHALKRAIAFLATDDDEQLKYAALDLRMAMESLTYDRARAYKDEFPPTEYETWQPRKVMAVLLEIDATADQDSTISFGIEETPGQHATEMTVLGTDKVLKMETLQKHYDALGSYLHVPTLKQISGGKGHNLSKLRERCTAISDYLTAVLASPVYNATFGNFASLECEECGQKLRKRMPNGKDAVDAECHSCKASYTVKDLGDGKVIWEPNTREVPCANPNCGHKIQIWRREFAAGSGWKCPECKGTNIICLGIRHDPLNDSEKDVQDESAQQ